MQRGSLACVISDRFFLSIVPAALNRSKVSTSRAGVFICRRCYGINTGRLNGRQETTERRDNNEKKDDSGGKPWRWFHSDAVITTVAGIKGIFFCLASPHASSYFPFLSSPSCLRHRAHSSIHVLPPLRQSFFLPSRLEHLDGKS